VPLLARILMAVLRCLPFARRVINRDHGAVLALSAGNRSICRLRNPKGVLVAALNIKDIFIALLEDLGHDRLAVSFVRH